KDLILCTAETGAEIWRTANANSTLIAFSDDGNLLGTAGGGERGSAFTVTVNETATQHPVLRVSEEALPIGIAFSHDGASIEVLDNNSSTRYYLSTKTLVDQTCQLLTRNLAEKDWTSFMGRSPYHRTCPNLP